MKTLNMNLIMLVLLSLAPMGCGDDEPGTLSEGLSGKGLMGLKFPEDKISGAKPLSAIPEGTYAIKKIQTNRLEKEINRSNYGAVHKLDISGEFDSDQDETAFEVDWKGRDKNLKDGSYVYSYEELNIPLTFKADANTIHLGKTIYYYNKVVSDLDYLNWGAAGNRSSRGRAYYKVFIEGEKDDKNVYHYDFDDDDVKARGIILIEGSLVRFIVEHKRNNGQDDEGLRVVELTFEKR